MAVVDDYLHYWFVHSDITVQNFNQEKEAALSGLSSAYQNREMARLSQNSNANEMLKIYEDMIQGNIIGQKLSNEIQAKYSQKVTAASDAGAGASFAQIAYWGPKMKKRKYQEGAKLAKKLADDLGSIIKNTENLLKDLEQTLQTHYPEAYTYALNVMCEDKYNNFSVNSKKAARELVQRTLSKGGGIEWVDSQSLQGNTLALAKDYVRLKQRLEALRVLEGPKTGYTDSTKGEFSARIIGKIGGTLNNVSGRMEEIAVGAAAGALLEREGQLSKMLPGAEAFAGVTGSGGFLSCQTKVKPSSDFMELLTVAEKNNSATFNKNDVTVIYSTGGALTTFGLSVKTSNASSTSKKTNSQKQVVKIHETSLAAVLNDAKGKSGAFSDYMTYNLAAAHTNSDVPALQAPAGVYTMWKSYVDYAIALNMLDYLAGDGSLYSNIALLVVNGQVFSIKEVLQQIEQNFHALSRSGNGAFKTSRFMGLNEWQGSEIGVDRNATVGQQRSATATENLQATFQAIKIQIRLDIANLSLTSL